MPPADLADTVSASSQQRSIIGILSRAYPRRVHRDALIDVLYSDDPDGGAEFARTVVAIQMNRLRQKLADTGWTIPKNKGGKGNKAFYTLAPTSA